MGSPPSEPMRSDDEPLHEVELTQGYWLGETTCTRALWEVVMGNNPSRFQEGSDTGERPVGRVSWEDCQVFLQRINELVPGLALRLPTEAEWERACRAGTETPFSFGENIRPEQVNYEGNYPYAGGEKGEYRKRTVAVRSLPANGWGFFEMHGNVWEWCADWYGKYEAGPVVDPRGPKRGGYPVLRGGSWHVAARFVRSANRSQTLPGLRSVDVGFRLGRGQGSGR